jgi:hypothetical protein
VSDALPDISLGGFRIDSMRVVIGSAPAFEADDSLVIAVNARVAEAGRPEKTIMVHNREVIPRMAVERGGRRLLVEQAMHCVRRMLEHEMEEWFSVDGKRWRDPHPPTPGAWTQHGVVQVLDRDQRRFMTNDGQWFDWDAGEGDVR